MINTSVSIESISLSDYIPLWTYVLSEIGKACVEEESTKALSTCRNLLNVRLTSCMPPISGDTGDLSYTNHLVWNNYQVLLFSISGIQSLYTVKRGNSISYNTLPASIRARLESFDISKLNLVKNFLHPFFRCKN